MIEGLGYVLCVLVGFASGVIIATGVVAFLLVLGVVPRLTAKTNTRTHFKTIETAAFLGAIVGNTLVMWEMRLALPRILIGMLGLLYGIFIGCLSIAIAEVLDIIPITKKRIRLKMGLAVILFVFALGKMIGGLYYWFHPLIGSM